MVATAAADLARIKAWRAANPEKVAEYTARYRKKRCRQRTEYQRAWRDKNRERSRQINRDHYSRHAEHRRAYAREWRAKNQDKRRSALIASYGLTPAEYETMLSAQRGACAICGTHPKTVLCIDHDHITGAVRGLLCVSCNTLVGRIERANLKKVWEYLGRNA